MNSVDLLCVFPNNRVKAYGSLGYEVAAITPPVLPGLLASCAREAGLSVSLLDADADGLLPDGVADAVQQSHPYLVIVFTDHVNSGDVTKMEAAGETIRAIHCRAPGVPVMLDGVVPTAYPEKMLRQEQADYICCGESFQPVIALVKKLASGKYGENPADGIPGVWFRFGETVFPGGRAPMVDDVDSLPDPAWDLMPPEKYRAHHWHCFDRLHDRSPYAAIYTNYGCPYNCSYCSVNIVAGRPNLRLRSVDRVVNEIDILSGKYGVRNIRILDNVFTVNPARLEELCDRIIALNRDLNFWAYARVESVQSPELLKKMRRAGIRWLAYGFESASERVRNAVNKKTETKAVEKVIEWTKTADISIVGNFIFGLPEDDLESMNESFRMAEEYQFEWANFYCAMAYPGTKLYDELIAQGIQMPEKWSAYSHYSSDSHPLSTKYTDWKDVVRFRDAAFEKYYSSPAYQKMITLRFGNEAAEFVRCILKHPLKRNFNETRNEH